MNYQLISSIVKGIWAIDPGEALGYAPLLQNIFGQSNIVFEFDKEAFKPFAISPTSQYSNYSKWNDAPDGSIAVIPVNGPLMKQDQYCGPIGMETMGKMVKEADKSPNISGIILKIDSPGGTVDGTETFANIVKSVQKPIMAIADGLMASAALWIGSASDEVWATTNKTQVGSIGTMMSFADLQPAYEKMGVKFHSIVADQSTDKNKVYEDLRAGKYDQYKKEVLNPLAEDFINAIKTNLNPTDDQLTGKVFFAQDVIGTLIDKVGTFDEAVTHMQELTKNNKKQNSNKPAEQMKQFENVNAVLGVAELASTDEGVFMNEQQLQLIETALANQSANQAAIDAAKQAQEKAEADLAAANQKIQDQEAELNDLRRTPGAETAKVVVEKDVISDEGAVKTAVKEGNSFLENMEAVTKEYL